MGWPKGLLWVDIEWPKLNLRCLQANLFSEIYARNRPRLVLRRLHLALMQFGLTPLWFILIHINSTLIHQFSNYGVFNKSSRHRYTKYQRNSNVNNRETSFISC